MRRIVPIPRLPVTISWALLSAANWHITSPGVLCSFLYNSNLIWKIKIKNSFTVILVKHLDKLIGHFASAGAYHPPGLRLCQCRLNYTMGLFWKTNADPYTDPVTCKVTCDGKRKKVYLYHVTKFPFTCRLLFIKITWNSVDSRQTIILIVHQGGFGHFTTIPRYFRKFSKATDDSRRLSKISED